MKRLFRSLVVTVSVSSILLPAVSFAKAPVVVNPPVKRSVNMICHAKGTRYYNQTKKFVSFSTLIACLRSGGRLPR